MNYIKYFAILLVFLYSCNSEVSKRNKIIIANGLFGEGNFINDSIPHGKVNLIDSQTSTNIGYSNYFYGQQIGAHVEIDLSGRKDSIFFRSPIKYGEEFIFDNLNNITYKASLYDERVVGAVFNFNKRGSLPHLYFYNFEGQIIYEVYYDSLGRYERGSPINYYVSQKNVNDVNVDVLFFYNIPQPDETSYYEIAILNSVGEVLESKKIDTNKFYHEVYLNKLGSDKHYALIYHYSSILDRDKVIIQKLTEN